MEGTPYADQFADNGKDGQPCGYVQQLQRARSRDSVVGVVTTLRAGLPRNCGSATDRHKRLLSRASMPGLRVIHPAAQWVPTVFSRYIVVRL